MRVTYGIKVSLGGKLPSSAVATIGNDLPAQSGRLRDVYYEHGHPPYIKMDPSSSVHSTLETEFFSLSGPEKQWQANITGRASGNLTIVYDTRRMYSGSGVDVTIQGDGKAGVQAADNGSGQIEINVGQEADGKKFTIFVHPKGSKVKA